MVRTEYATWTSLIGAVRALGPQADMQSMGVIIRGVIIGGEQVREAEQMVRGVNGDMEPVDTLCPVSTTKKPWKMFACVRC